MVWVVSTATCAEQKYLDALTWGLTEGRHERDFALSTAMDELVVVFFLVFFLLNVTRGAAIQREATC